MRSHTRPLRGFFREGRVPHSMLYALFVLLPYLLPAEDNNVLPKQRIPPHITYNQFEKHAAHFRRALVKREEEVWCLRSGQRANTRENKCCAWISLILRKYSMSSFLRRTHVFPLFFFFKQRKL